MKTQTYYLPGSTPTYLLAVAKSMASGAKGKKNVPIALASTNNPSSLEPDLKKLINK